MRRRAVVGVVSAGLAAATLVGCGGGSTSQSSTPTASSDTASTTQTTSHGRRPVHQRTRRPRPQAPPVGRTQRVHANGSILSVTVTKVYDPLPDTGSALLPGAHAAGIQLTIRNDAGATYDSTASGDVSVLTSSGMPAPLFVKHGICATPLTDFESLIGVGESRSGCVGVAIPHGARIIAVRFSPDSRAGGSVTWR